MFSKKELLFWLSVDILCSLVFGYIIGAACEPGFTIVEWNEKYTFLNENNLLFDIKNNLSISLNTLCYVFHKE